MAHGITPPRNRAARILIVDDHPMMREGIAMRVSGQSDMEVCGEAASVSEAMAQVRSMNPDLLIVDIALADSYGIDLIKQVKQAHPHIKTLVVSAYEESLYGERCLRAGAAGYINKRECHENILPAIRAVLEGRRYLSAEMTQALLQQAISGLDPAKTNPIDRLSDRELQVFRLIGQGSTTSAIADRLHLSIHTIESHRENIKHKLGAKSGLELQRQAMQWTLEHG